MLRLTKRQTKNNYLSKVFSLLWLSSANKNKISMNKYCPDNLDSSKTAF